MQSSVPVPAGLTKASNMLDDASTMKESPATTLDQRIASRVRELRAAQGLSLEALATRSGVSRSMISVIERGESSATAVVLDKIATGLAVPLASLFDAPAAPAQPVARAADHPPWRDPASGYVRRNVSPAGYPTPIQIVEVLFPPRARVAYESGALPSVVHQQIWVMEGRMEVTVGETLHRLEAGDCLAHRLDQPISYYNPGRQTAHYAVVLASLP